MKKFLFLIAVIGLTFSQAELSWKTTHGTYGEGEVRLQSNKIKVTVYPGYLDVEEEAEIQTLGETPWGGDANSLEIFGDFSLPKGAAVVSLLLWNGQDLLKARLKDRALARQQYEKVVDRNTPPPPRPWDPALVEFLGGGRYGLSIYPVRQGFSRKIRLRYHVAAEVTTRGVELPFSTVIARAIPGDRNAVIETSFHPGSRKEGFTLGTATGLVKPLALPATYLFATPQDLRILSQNNAVGITTSFAEGGYQGHYISLHAPLPAAVKNSLQSFASLKQKPSLTAEIRKGNETMHIDMTCSGKLDLCRGLAFTGKASAPFSARVDWVVHSGGSEKLRHTQEFPMADQAKDSILAILWAANPASYTEKTELQRGTRYGFVDATASLLALEEDVMNAEDTRRYWDAGVPRLTDAEIFPSDTTTGFSANEILFQFNPNQNPNPNPNQPWVTSLAAPEVRSEKGISGLLRGGNALQFHLPENWRSESTREALITVVLFGLDGQELGRWTLQNPSEGLLELRIQGQVMKPGLYLLRVEGASLRTSHRLKLM